MSLIKKWRRETYKKRTDRVKKAMEKHRPMVSCLALAHPVAVKEQERLASNLEYVSAKTEYWDKRIVEELEAS